MTSSKLSYIQEQIKNNDCKLSVIDLREEKLELQDLKLLRSLLKNNDIVCNIKWGDIPADKAAQDEITAINRKIFYNLDGYKLFPNDFKYGLLSLHSYENATLGAAPDLSAQGYGNHLGEWKVTKVYRNENNSYYSVLYQNSKLCQTVLAHRGTKLESGILTELISLRDAHSDINGILLKKIISPILDAYKAVSDSIEISKQEGYHLSFTGHSLGAWLAEMSLYFAQKDFFYKSTRAVTFDSPGTFEYFESLKPNIKNKWTNFNDQSLDITTYLSILNIVNSCNTHIGQTYAVTPKITVAELKEARDHWANTEFMGYKYINLEIAIALYSIIGHKLESILNEFDSNTGLPREYKQMLDWPCISNEYKSETDHIYSTVKGWLKSIPLVGGFLNYAPDSVYTWLAPKAMVNSPSYKLANILIDLVNNKANLEQYWHTIAHEVVLRLDNDNINWEEDVDRSFYLQYKGHFHPTEPNLFLEPISGIKFQSDWYLSEFIKHRKFFEYRASKDCGLNLIEKKTIYNLVVAVEYSGDLDNNYEYGLLNSTFMEIPIDRYKQTVMRLNQVTDSAKLRSCIEMTTDSIFLYKNIMKQENDEVVTELTEEFINNGGDIAIQDFDGNTMLHYAVTNHHEKAASLLVQNGADVDINNKDGDSPLQIAIKMLDVSTISVLKQFSHINNTGITILMNRYGVYEGNKKDNIFEIKRNYEGKKEGYKLVIDNFQSDKDKIDLSDYDLQDFASIKIEEANFTLQNVCKVLIKASNEEIVSIVTHSGECSWINKEMFILGEDSEL